MLPVLYKIAREVTKWQCTLYDYFHIALNEALKKEDERLKIATGEVMTRGGKSSKKVQKKAMASACTLCCNGEERIPYQIQWIR